MEKVVKQIKQVADSTLTLLIQGETGTGKELVARATHQLSERRKKAFVAVDCGAIPDTLIESELFGYEKGAFTGAHQRKAGLFPRAEGGSLFLDEIVNLPLPTQGKLLRALQERQVQAPGGKQPGPVDARIDATPGRAGAQRCLSEGDRRGGVGGRRAAGDPPGPPGHQGEQERGGAAPPNRLQDPAPQDEAVRHTCRAVPRIVSVATARPSPSRPRLVN